MKKMICKILSAIMILTSVTAISVSADEAVPTTSTVLVNGNNINFDSSWFGICFKHNRKTVFYRV